MVDPVVQTSTLGLGESRSRFVEMLSHALASAGGDFFLFMFGHNREYCALICNQWSKSATVSGLMALTGHSGSHIPQSMHSTGWITSMFSPS
jgi:hypothetical protein